MKRRLWLFLPLLLAGVLIGYRQLPSDISASLMRWFTEDDALLVKAVQVKKSTITHVMQGSGELRPVKEAQVVSHIAGYVGEIRKVGDSVAEGQIIATLRAKELIERAARYETALTAAQVNLREKEKLLGEALKQWERTRELHSRNLIAANDVSEAGAAADTARAQRDLAEAQVEQHQAALAQSRYLLGLSKLPAPFGGVVTRRLIEIGSYVQSGTPVLTITGLDPLKVTIEIPAKDLNSVREGWAAEIRIATVPDRIFPGKVAALHSRSQTTQDAAVAEIHVSNRERLLKTGMQVSVTLSLGEKWDALLVPKRAVVDVQGKSHVYIVVNDKVEGRAVTTGWDQLDLVEVTTGVNEGEWIVIDDPRSLKPNRKVHRMKVDGEP